MDGVERVMVLGIFAVIVAILSIAAWGVTADDPVEVAATDGGVAIDGTSLSPSGSPGTAIRLGEGRETLAEDEDRLIQDLIQGSRTPPSAAGGPAAGGATSAGANGRRRGEVRGEIEQPGTAAERDPLPLKSARPTGEGAAVPPAPIGEAEVIEESLFVLYEIQSGDTLWTIARQEFGEGDTSRIVAHIKSINPDVDASAMAIGRKIKLPRVLPEGLVTPPLAEQADAEGQLLYTIREGDSLQRIAQLQLGDSGRWKEIWNLNKARITDPERIHVGQTILLPES